MQVQNRGMKLAANAGLSSSLLYGGICAQLLQWRKECAFGRDATDGSLALRIQSGISVMHCYA